ncbi:hypothetical protein AKJ08_3231 [Vulgatibacter incomptus]|uniref:Uncharacterized protein n=1 Tax=Vulgatibacter incomptus TaxID=1391653 RepID=A0A0K1PIA6_9BACT|nr:hypothetical protein AKJ08_3231 [Vulgatibacter incomptus]
MWIFARISLWIAEDPLRDPRVDSPRSPMLHRPRRGDPQALPRGRGKNSKRFRWSRGLFTSSQPLRSATILIPF